MAGGHWEVALLLHENGARADAPTVTNLKSTIQQTRLLKSTVEGKSALPASDSLAKRRTLSSGSANSDGEYLSC